MFNVLIRNNEQFDQNLRHITFFSIFLRNIIAKQRKSYSYLDWYFVLFIQICTQIYWCQELFLFDKCFLICCS